MKSLTLVTTWFVSLCFVFNKASAIFLKWSVIVFPFLFKMEKIKLIGVARQT